MKHIPLTARPPGPILARRALFYVGVGALCCAGRAAEPERAVLVACWELDEGRGAVARDSAPGRSDARILGARWCEGKFGSALFFDGKGAHVKAPHIPLAERSFTIEMFINPYKLYGTVYTGPVLFYQGVAATNLLLQINVSRRGEIKVDFYHNGLRTTRTRLALDQWHHVALTYAATSRERCIYVDGKLVGRGIARAAYLGTRGDALIGGCGLGRASFHGAIDEVRIYHGVLNEAEVRERACRHKDPAQTLAAVTIVADAFPKYATVLEQALDDAAIAEEAVALLREWQALRATVAAARLPDCVSAAYSLVPRTEKLKGRFLLRSLFDRGTAGE